MWRQREMAKESWRNQGASKRNEEGKENAKKKAERRRKHGKRKQ